MSKYVLHYTVHSHQMPHASVPFIADINDSFRPCSDKWAGHVLQGASCFTQGPPSLLGAHLLKKKKKLCRKYPSTYSFLFCGLIQEHVFCVCPLPSVRQDKKPTIKTCNGRSARYMVTSAGTWLTVESWGCLATTRSMSFCSSINCMQCIVLSRLEVQKK